MMYNFFGRKILYYYLARYPAKSVSGATLIKTGIIQKFNGTSAIQIIRTPQVTGSAFITLKGTTNHDYTSFNCGIV